MTKVAIVSFMMVSFLLEAFYVFGQEQAPAPSFAEGDFWQFKVREWDWITQITASLNGGV